MKQDTQPIADLMGNNINKLENIIDLTLEKAIERDMSWLISKRETAEYL